MFTGLIEKKGKIITKSNELVVEIKDIDSKIGDSISINGICLTVAKIENNKYHFDISYETLDKTNFKYLNTSEEVNIERAMLVSDRFHGHIVTGHIDTVSKILSIDKSKNITFRISSNNNKYLVNKGSVAINGVSLTVSKVFDNSFEIVLIPHTLNMTNLLNLRVGSYVNVEFDILAKYAQNMVVKAGIDEDFLRRNGYV